MQSRERYHFFFLVQVLFFVNLKLPSGARFCVPVCISVRGCTTVRTPIRTVPSDNLLWLSSLISVLWPLRRFDNAGKNIPWGSCIPRISFQNPMTSWWNSFDSISFYLIQHTSCTQCCEMRPCLCLISKRRSQRNSIYLNQQHHHRHWTERIRTRFYM